MKATYVVIGFVMSMLAGSAVARDGWADDPVWHDGLVEKAVYAASRVVYDKPRAYEAVFFTNKEQHDLKTLTKSDKSTETIEVWKLNQVEVIPTPNYDYKYVTTAHHAVDGMLLTRLDCGSQEFCGTSFKQYQRRARSDPRAGSNAWDYFGFSYMPEAGRVQQTVRDADGRGVVPFNSLPLWLRDFDFAKRQTVKFLMLPDQKSNRPTPHEPVEAEVRYAGEEAEAHKLELHVGGKLAGTFWMATDPSRRHVMLKYRGADGQQYDLKSVERVNYWTIKE
jgi:hypothetical protein